MAPKVKSSRKRKGKSTQIKLRHKLDLQGRRMVCAYTNDNRSVWATFLKRQNPTHTPEKLQRLRLHSTPSLNHNAADLTLDDIDYSTVSKEMGKYVTRHDFEQRAFSLWTYNCDMKLKSRARLERSDRKEGDNHDSKESERKADYSGDSSDVSIDDVSDDDWGCKAVMENEMKKDAREMTPGEALEIQQQYLCPDADEDPVDRHRFALSIKKYGHITADRLTEVFDNKEEKWGASKTTSAKDKERK